MEKEHYIELIKELADVWAKAEKWMLIDGIEKHAFTVKLMEASHWMESYYRMNKKGDVTVEATLKPKIDSVP